MEYGHTPSPGLTLDQIFGDDETRAELGDPDSDGARLVDQWVELWTEIQRVKRRPAHWFTARVAPRETATRKLLRWFGLVD